MGTASFLNEVAEAYRKMTLLGSRQPSVQLGGRQEAFQEEDNSKEL